MILEALRKVGLADDILPTQIIARDQGPYDRHLSLELNFLVPVAFSHWIGLILKDIAVGASHVFKFARKMSAG